MPSCFCGKGVRQWSALLEQGFCSEEHYEEKAGKSEATGAMYIAHGLYEEKTDV